jgi:signal peptidase II
MMRRWLWLAVVVVVLDQATKLLALYYLQHGPVAVAPFLNLALAFNPGAAFSFLADAGGWQNLLFVAIAIVVSIVILVMTWRLGAGDTQVAAGLMLVLGGAIGNVIDRLRFGHVVDFIDVYYETWHWPTFNVADSAITVGAVLLVLDAFGVRWRRG